MAGDVEGFSSGVGRLNVVGARAPTRSPANDAAYYPLFDWLRIVLASVVCFQHFGLIDWEYSGDFAVQVFFALSGWLIGGILSRCRPADLPRFFYNRGTRIWLPYAVAIVIFYTFAAFDRLDAWWFKALFYDLTFTHNLFMYLPDQDMAFAWMPLKGSMRHFWSISVEEQFYLVSAFVIVLAPLGRNGLVWLAVGVVGLCFGVHATAIALGVAAALLFAGRAEILRRVPVRVALLGCIVGGFALLLLRPDDYEHIAPVAAAPIVLLLAVPGARDPYGAFLGGVSYPLYLNHKLGIFATHLLQKVLPLDNWAVAGVTSYVIALLAATALYLGVDCTIMARRATWFTAARGTAFMATAIGLFTAGLIGGLTMIVTVGAR